MDGIITSLDVGTTKVCAVIGEPVDDGTLHIIGFGQAPSRGLRKGVVVDVAEATEAIGEALAEAERSAGIEIVSAYVGITGSHIAGFSSRGVIALPRNIYGVTPVEVERALEAARTIAIPHNREIIHTLPRSFTVDEQEGIRDPIGMHGYRLEVDAQIITGASSCITTLIKCVQNNGVAVDDLVLEPLASGEAVLTAAEREMGVAIADIGGGTTDIAIFLDGALWHTVVLDVGGNHLTQDVAVGLRMPFEAAEELKIRHGHARPQRLTPDEPIKAKAFGAEGERVVSRHFLAEILEARTEEILDLILREVKRSGYDGLLPAGVVLTGGSAQLAGLKELSQEIFELPVRVGMPRHGDVTGLADELRSPAYATSVGLLLWGMRRNRTLSMTSNESDSLFARIGRWLRSLLPEEEV
ncbi:MAG TPA: cell division protein FtsA [Anaerolineae bacterium]|nr:cell division protein FtsA [Anaerolineae bacterium]HIQ04936.1 cell division protein FtsA [Anaerolineae bacterium]